MTPTSASVKTSACNLERPVLSRVWTRRCVSNETFLQTFSSRSVWVDDEGEVFGREDGAALAAAAAADAFLRSG